MQLAGVFIKDSARGVLTVTFHVMVAARFTAPGEVAQLDRRLAVDAQSLDSNGLVGFVFFLYIGEDRVGLRDFFWGLALTTRRNRYPNRLRILAMVPAAGNCSSR